MVMSFERVLAMSELHILQIIICCLVFWLGTNWSLNRLAKKDGINVKSKFERHVWYDGIKMSNHEIADLGNYMIDKLKKADDEEEWKCLDRSIEILDSILVRRTNGQKSFSNKG
jgi:hypothetical protein